MIQDALTATAARYYQRWQHYLHEQETGRRSKHLTPSERAWCDGAVLQRIARVGLDRLSIVTAIAAELHGDTCLQHVIIMVPNVAHDPTGDYVLLVDDRPHLPPEAQAQRVVQALGRGTPTIFNTDQGSQFTAQAFTTLLDTAGVHISMDGRGRVFDNIFIERLWRTVKYEHLYLYDYDTVPAVTHGLDQYFQFYNTERPHQSLGYRTPMEVHTAAYADPTTSRRPAPALQGP